MSRPPSGYAAVRQSVAAAGWWMAVAAVLSIGLLVLAGGNLLPAAVLAALAVAVTAERRIRSRRRPRP